jgi:hypothetical protein
MIFSNMCFLFLLFLQIFLLNSASASSPADFALDDAPLTITTEALHAESPRDQIKKIFPNLYRGDAANTKALQNLCAFLQTEWQKPHYDVHPRAIYDTPFDACIPFARELADYIQNQPDDNAVDCAAAKAAVLPFIRRAIHINQVSYNVILVTAFRFQGGISPLNHFDDAYPCLNTLTDFIARNFRNPTVWQSDDKSMLAMQQMYDLMNNKIKGACDIIESKNTINQIFKCYNLVTRKMPLIIPSLYLNTTFVGIRTIIDAIIANRPPVAVSTFTKAKDGDGKLFSPINFTAHDWLHFYGVVHHDSIVRAHALIKNLSTATRKTQKWNMFGFTHLISAPDYNQLTNPICDYITKQKKLLNNYLIYFLAYLDEKFLDEYKTSKHLHALHQHYSIDDLHNRSEHKIDDDYKKTLIALFIMLHEPDIPFNPPLVSSEFEALTTLIEAKSLVAHTAPLFSDFPIDFKNKNKHDKYYAKTIECHHCEIKSYEKILKLLASYQPYQYPAGQQPQFLKPEQYTNATYQQLYETLLPEWNHINHHVHDCIKTFCTAFLAYNHNQSESTTPQQRYSIWRQVDDKNLLDTIVAFQK